MSWSSRRAGLILSALVLVSGLALVGHVLGQPKPLPGPGVQLPALPGRPAPGGDPATSKKNAYDLGSLTLPKDDDLRDRIEAAIDRIKEKDWKRAIETLQALLSRPEDVFVPVQRRAGDGSEMTAYVSVKQEAARLIASLPKEGRDVYEATYGDQAMQMVKRARSNNDFREMAQAMSLYLYTNAGVDAATWLGTYMLDRGEFQGASRFFSLLINRGGIAAVRDRTLLKAAYAFHNAGDTRGLDQVFAELQRRGITLRLRDEERTVAELREAINRLPASIWLQNASDSPIYRSRPGRNAMLSGGTPFLDALWRSRPLASSEQTRAQIKQAETALGLRNLPVLTSFVPVTATLRRGEKTLPLIIYRSFWGLHALDVKTGKIAWDSRSDWSLDTILGATGKERDNASQKITAYQSWLSFYQNVAQNVRAQMIFENSVLNTLSSDNRMVYAVEDLPIPPPQNYAAVNPRFGGMPAPLVDREVMEAINHNKLQALDLTKEGKLAWEIGGVGDGPLDNSYFLGPPLPLGGRLYVLNEKQQELRLLTLDPATGKLLAMQPLAATKDLKLSQDPLRRTQAAHLAYGEGILVVPTNAGAVFGYDLLSNSLLWAYPYRNKNAPQTPPQSVNGPGALNPRIVIGGMIPQVAASLESYWQVTAPAIQDGKVVFTAPDEKEMHCVSLRDGTRLWSHMRQEDDLYFAGLYNSRALIVGKKKTRAVSLASGQVLWELPTGMPSGQGAASTPNAEGRVLYYLPIRENPSSREPEICCIDVDRGIIQAHIRSRKKEVPGNLLFYEGNVLSQNHLEVACYPQLERKLNEMNQLLAVNANDPEALSERGDYLLDKGDLAGAIADFRLALRNNPSAAVRQKTRDKLYEALTEYLQRDFNRAEEFLTEYEELCKVDLGDTTGTERAAREAESRRRRANFLCLVGKGREAQNRLVEAFDRYLELGNEGKELIQVVDEPAVQAAPDVWAQGRIAAMVRNARDAEQKKQLEERIVARWNRLRESRAVPLDELRRFVALFGSLFGVGREARLALAERLMEDTDINSLLEAEQQLHLLRSEVEQPEVAARAIEALARLNTRKGLLEDAAYYYRQLGERFGAIRIDGKTGKEYLDELATDKRFLPYLDQTSRYILPNRADLRFSETPGNFPVSVMQYQFGHAGEPLPFFTRHKLALTFEWPHNLKLIDSSTGEERWRLRLTQTQFQQIAQANNQGHRVKFNFQSLGHLVILQLGHMVFAIDPLSPRGRVIWEKNLSSLPGSTGTMPTYQSLTIDPRDNSIQLLYIDGWTQRLGEMGVLTGGIVCLPMRDELVAVDPLSGRVLWKRSDVNSRSAFFGDEQHLYVVHLNPDGSAAGTRVFRAYDGVLVNTVPDFSKHYDRRIRQQGRTLLTSSLDAKNALTLRLVDLFDGKDLWRQTYPAGTLILNSEDARLGGVIEPDGSVHVIDLLERKEVLTTKINPRDLAGALAVHLLADQDAFYLAVNGPADPNIGPFQGGVQPNVQPGSGLRSIPVNGEVYAFNRATGKLQWQNEVKNQHLILSLFDELPVVLFTARYQYQNPPPIRQWVMKHTATAIAKRSGKRWYDAENLPQGMFFHTLSMDHRTGKIEFTGGNLRVVLTAHPR